MAQGEVLGFEEYVRTRQDALLRSARRLVPDPVDAQDLLQTALARTFGRWDGIADKSLADAYLRRVMINTRTEWWRARKLDEVPTEQLPDASVEDGTEQRADRALLMDVLGVLAPKQRSVVVLRHWEQMSTEETAAALGMSAGTVKSTLHRALARLRQELENREAASREALLAEERTAPTADRGPAASGAAAYGRTGAGAVRGLTAGDDGGNRGDDDGAGRDDDGVDHGGADGAGRAAVRRGRSPGGRAAGTVGRGGIGWTAGATTLVGFTALALLVVGCSSGGTGTRDEGPAGTQPVAQVTPSPGASMAKPTFRVDAVTLIKKDPRVSERVRTDLKPCVGSEYPVDTSYGTLTGGSSTDVVVNVMTCADSVGVGTYVYRRESGGVYRNVFTMEQPAVYGTIDRGDLVVTAQVYGKKDAVAYPSGEDVITYRWAGDRFDEHDRVHNDFNRAVGSGTAGLPESAEPVGN